jgi:hypothetical protein
MEIQYQVQWVLLGSSSPNDSLSDVQKDPVIPERPPSSCYALLERAMHILPERVAVYHERVIKRLVPRIRCFHSKGWMLLLLLVCSSSSYFIVSNLNLG